MAKEYIIRLDSKQRKVIVSALELELQINRESQRYADWGEEMAELIAHAKEIRRAKSALTTKRKK